MLRNHLEAIFKFPFKYIKKKEGEKKKSQTFFFHGYRNQMKPSPVLIKSVIVWTLINIFVRQADKDSRATLHLSQLERCLSDPA